MLVQLAMTLLASAAPTPPSGEEDSASEERTSVADALLAARPGSLEELLREALERSPRVARARRLAAAEAQVAPQVNALPDPVAGLSFFLLAPETRVGPQRLQATLSQKLPWSGKLSLRNQAALYSAAAVASEVWTVELDVITEARRLYYELAFLEELVDILEGERETLRRHEEAARARYSAGSGLQQEVIRIQAQITRVTSRLIGVSERNATVLASINAVRDRPAATPVEGLVLPLPAEPSMDGGELRQTAYRHRPELLSADARIAQFATMVDLARKNFYPDVTLGLGYTLVEKRDDPASRVSPPLDNGQDILAVSSMISLPVRRRRLNAGLRESLERQFATEEEKRQILASIESTIGDISTRLPLLFEQWQLLEGVLLVQAEEALRSAEVAYSTGRLNAVDLLDAEVILFEVRTAIARTRTDYARSWADLERAVAAPLDLTDDSGDSVP
jgi:outer membrane protein TolC